MMRTVVIAFLCLIAGSGWALSQSSRTADKPAVLQLSVSDAVAMAVDNNFDLRMAAYEKRSSEADMQKSLSVFLPRLSASETFVATKDPLNVFGLKLKQSGVAASDFDPISLNHPSTFQNFMTKVEVQQPLLNLDGFYGRHAAGKGVEAAEFTYTRTQYGIELAVKSAYYAVALSRKRLEVIRDALRAAEAYRAQANDFYGQGLIQRADYLMTEVRVLDLTRTEAESRNGIDDAENNLRLLLGVGDPIPLSLTDTLSFFPVDSVTYNIGEVNAQRSDMKAMGAGLEALDALSAMQKTKFLPTLNAFVTYEWNGQHLSGTPGNNWTVGAVLQWNLLAGFDQVGDLQKSAAKRSLLQTELAKRRIANANDLSSANGMVGTSRRLVALTQEMESQAAEQLRITEERYAAGLERTSDLLQVGAVHAEAQLKYLEATYRYTVALFTMEFLLERKVTR